MEKFHQFIIRLFPAVFLLCLFQLTASETVETEALLEFKNLLNDPLNHLKSWNYDKHPCQFTGIICHSESMNVIGISLMNMSLSGKLSPSLSSLRNLSSLQLQWNLISGAIPPQLANCTSLQFLNMSYNSFTGEVPDLSSLQKLQVLDLTKSGLTGKFPSWVGNLPELVHLALAYNDFEEGEVVPSLGNLKNLNVMFLAQCNLKGEIPSFISNLTSLGTFDLSQNQMSGEFPIFLTNLPKLWKIELFRNNLSGEIPPELGNLTSLREIDLSVNQMTGKIPTEVGNLNLTVFQIYRNNLSGEIPQGFGSMQFLDSFSIYENSFSGEFPADFGRFSRLNSIDISENNFTGPFPRFLCQNNNLQYLLALDNYFSGEFPDSYSTCKTLLRFRVSQNYLSGKIPDGVWGLPSAVIIDLADNGFSGGISSDIGMSTSLTQLYVQNNKFSGELPAEIGKLSQLQKIFAYNNSFSGQIPSEIGELSQLSSLQLEVNSLTGPVPLDIGKCSCLVDLNLAQNALNGNIPSSLTVLTSLNSLNLSNNRLVGSIPLGLQVLKLSSLDFSHNQLSGTIPPELLIIAGDNAFSRNPGLCIDQNSGNHCKFTSGHKGFFGRRIGVALVIMLIMFVLIAGLAIISYRNFMLEQSCKNSDIENGIYDQSKWKMESFHPSELNAEEISNLEEENLIGSGSTGKVYKLELNKNRGTVAVKQLWKGKGAKVMMAEIGILANIRHRNILKLYACLTKGESSYLVFEYMPNGNLHQALRRQVKGKQAELDWNRRYNIALGAAKGLMYLHHHCTPAIIHRDIKTANILLDEEYEAKIADFGIAKVAEDSDNSCFAGTHGYMAPELAYSLKVSEKSDVYSFGVVLLELLTGFTPTEPQFGEGKDIVYWVSTQLDGQKVRSMFDSRISDTASDDMIKVLRVAILCTKKLPSLRPSMREVVNMLNDADPCRVKNFVKKA